MGCMRWRCSLRAGETAGPWGGKQGTGACVHSGLPFSPLCAALLGPLKAPARGGPAKTIQAWIRDHPSAFCRPVPDPEELLQKVAAALGCDVGTVQLVAQQHINLITVATDTLDRRVTDFADLLGVERQQAQRLLLTRPGLLSRSATTLAQVLDSVPRLLGVPAAAYRAEAGRNSRLLLIPVTAAARRVRFLQQHAELSDEWWAEWQAMALSSRATVLCYADARLARLTAALAAGADKEHSMAVVLRKSEADLAVLLSRRRG